MHPDQLRVTGARENNLRNISVDIPKRQLTVFTGVSGSGKSSLVFDTIAAEAQRQLNETFTAFARTFLPSYGHPDVDQIENLSAAIVVDQHRLGGGSRSTVGTITDIAPLLRLLFSRAGEPHVGYANSFSFNDPAGMCPGCDGIGRRTEVDLDAFLDESRSLNEGALLAPVFAVGSWMWQIYAASGFVDPDKKVADYTDEERHLVLYATGLKVPVEVGGGEMNATYEGAVERFTRLYIRKDAAEMSERTRAMAARLTTSATCPECHGARLSPAALACRVDGRGIAELSAMEAVELVTVLDSLDVPPPVKPVLESLHERVRDLVDIGLSYLSLDRETASLSGGESQRVKMVRHLASSLTDMLYVFDEPSIGLHARDVARLNTLLWKLRDKGNTVLVVEHDRDVIAAADHVIDIGPGAGPHGGEIVFTGTVAELEQADTLTGRYLHRRLTVKEAPRRPTGALPITDAALHNLQHVTVDIPTGVLTVVTGVAGSGKSSLINGVFLTQHPGAVVIDQSAVSANRRSSTATYTGMLDVIRKAFAKANGVSASLFSANSEGACPECSGLGIIWTDLAFMEGMRSTCEVCEGRRFKDEVLVHRLRGRSISDVLDMTAAEALDFFTERKLRPILQAVNDVGLEYLRLGQPLSTLSGGECQRIKLATELHKEGAVYVMDEPTTGLHMSDVGRLLGIIDGLVDRGNTVIVIEHDLDVIRNADWIIDLGPEGGSGGGRVLFEGPPARFIEATGSHTAESLRRDLARHTPPG